MAQTMPVEAAENCDMLSRLLSVVEELSYFKDLDALLDRILFLARQLTNAEAGSIYLVDKGCLHFSYTHNDILFGSTNNKEIYTSHILKINHRSIAGYVAATGESLLIADAYQLPGHFPFIFNNSFDRLSGYRTRSILTIPLKTSRRKIVGVLQIINAISPNGTVTSFSERDRDVLTYFGNHAGTAIERAAMGREMVLRMIRMCELRDPSETGPHASRVAAYSAELYQKWAGNRGLASDEIKKTKDMLRISAMLHDLGKIAISDTILRKPGKLEPAEYQTMQFHTIYGARLFENSDSELDLLSAEIALNHHERWDGQGYPGKIADIYADRVQIGAGKQGEEIPIHGRIVALADVYDALVSKRAYKESLPEDRVLDYIREESGKGFDPEVVEAFFAIHEVILAIREKYQDEGPRSRSLGGPEAPTV
jgi:HD-GYP domain-containing protein (c-di-GMP phosphodiesterase class II)